MSGCDSFGQDCGADMVEDLDGEYVLWDDVLPHLYRYDEYTATPSTVSVPDAATAIRACIDEFPESVRDIVEECASIAENACRAAMLHGAEPVSQTYKLNELSGNSPVTPDGWISCSERMPDKLIPVMVMYEDGEMWSAMWNGNRWDDGTEYPDPHSVTHWREMPAAPQQEVK
ncbi:TPA: DUF551 domain-containing protein [Escherichia coli]|nr:DUF551 domain-containing protein [Escherichia coli]